MEGINSFSNCYRDLVMNCKTPILINEPLDWDLFEWSLMDWSNIFQDRILAFRCGKKQCKKFPLWEGQCVTNYSSFQKFIEFCNDVMRSKNEWKYFDYKHIPEYFDASIFKTISWEKLGFPEKGAESSTLWIGSSGAHTPCHVDTYGCNIVVQVYGKKRWILFPFHETENLKPTRIPYEESSIYSNVNFFCYHSLKNIIFENCYMIDLNPGDILLIPPKWWHYVENLSTAISINTWIPHKDDDDWRIQEGLVKLFVSSLASNLSDELKQEILNPNERVLETSSTCFNILNHCKEKKSLHEETKFSSRIDYSSKNLVHGHKYKLIRKISDDNLKSELRRSSHCVPSDTDFKPLNNDVEKITSVINAFCHPSVIDQVKNKFLGL